MSKVVQAVKATLSTGKIVILRQMRISDSEVAAAEVASRAGGNQSVLQLLMQKALVKNLLLQIDGSPVSAAAREDMDELFTLAEYNQVLKVVEAASGGSEMGKEPQIEAVNFGDK